MMKQTKSFALLVAVCLTALFACKSGPSYNGFSTAKQLNAKNAEKKAQDFLNAQAHNLNAWSDMIPSEDSSDPQGVSFSDWGQTQALNKDEIADTTSHEAIEVSKRTLKASKGEGKKKGTADVTSEKLFFNIDGNSEQFTAANLVMLSTKLFPNKCGLGKVYTDSATFPAPLKSRSENLLSLFLNDSRAGDAWKTDKHTPKSLWTKQQPGQVRTKTTQEKSPLLKASYTCAYNTLIAILGNNTTEKALDWN